MDWGQFAILLGTLAGVFFWNRTETRADQRQIISLIQGIQGQINAIQQEMKDFHGRLERQDAEFKAHLMHYHKE